MDYYLDISVLLVFTLACGKEIKRYFFVEKLFTLINTGKIKAKTSFYALHELYLFSLENAPDFDSGAQYGKEAINQILASKIQLTPLITRMERLDNAHLFDNLPDKSDLPHAISAKIWDCDVIVAYDDHFNSITDTLKYKRPEEIIAKFKS